MGTNKKYYPSKRKKVSWRSLAEDKATIEINKPYTFENDVCDSIFNEWKSQVMDEWYNNVASVNANNSIMQHSNFILERLTYAECASLFTDSIINNAIGKIVDDIFSRGGKFKVESQEYDNDKIQLILKREFQRLEIWETLREAVETNLTYGGCLIFIDVDTDDLESELFIKKEILQNNKFRGLRVIPPYLTAPSSVETANPLSYQFMKPSKWFVSGGAGVVDSSRLINLSFYEAPALIKPMYNFFGIPYTQFMKNYVKTADIARQALGDLLLRFRSEAIKTDLVKINMEDAKIRAKAINKMKNNLGVLLLTPDEEYIQTITPIAGLDKIIAQMQENIAVSARMPAVKLLGLTPSGFNATGDFDLHSYYDLISSLQNTNVKPIIEKVADIVLKGKGIDCYIEYEFDILEKESSLQKAQVENLAADFVGKNIMNGVITQEQGMEYLKDKELLKSTMKYNTEAETNFVETNTFNNSDENY